MVGTKYKKYHKHNQEKGWKDAVFYIGSAMILTCAILFYMVTISKLALGWIGVGLLIEIVGAVMVMIVYGKKGGDDFGEEERKVE
jgi:hypothetical protein